MAKKTGLGRGLDALFSDTIKEPEIEEVTGEIVQNIKITKIEPDKEQPRKRFDEEKLEELANSIKQYGVIQPIIVTLKDDYYQIVLLQDENQGINFEVYATVTLLEMLFAIIKNFKVFLKLFKKKEKNYE